jgi:hypothetical protein
METGPPAATLARAQNWLRHIIYQDLAQWDRRPEEQRSRSESEAESAATREADDVAQFQRAATRSPTSRAQPDT